MRCSWTLSLLLALALTTAQFGCTDGGTPEEAWPVDRPAEVPVCSGDNDGVVDPGELDFSPGAARVAPYAVQAEGDSHFGVSGDLEAGEGVWDFSTVVFDRLEELPLIDPAGLWYADVFPAATLALPMSPGAEGEVSVHMLLAASDDGLEILGLASVEPDEQLLRYTVPVPMMRFPMEQGQQWGVTTEPAEGSVFAGIPLVGSGMEDHYQWAVDGGGSLRMPGMILHGLLRLSLLMERTLLDGQTFTQRETYLVHECLGTVARRSEPDGEWWVVWYPL